MNDQDSDHYGTSTDVATTAPCTPYGSGKSCMPSSVSSIPTNTTATTIATSSNGPLPFTGGDYVGLGAIGVGAFFVGIIVSRVRKSRVVV